MKKADLANQQSILKQNVAADLLWVFSGVLVVFCFIEIFDVPTNKDFVSRLKRFFERSFPPDFSILPSLLSPFLETAKIAVVSTFLATVISFPLSVFASRDYSVTIIRSFLRVVLNGIRSVPSIVWAVVSVAILGAGPLAGAVALTIYSVGYLAKFFVDSFDSISPDLKWALKDNGASLLQSFAHGTWPSVRLQIFSHALWMLEYNLRASTIIGYVGAGGIGLRLHIYQEFGQWERFTAVLLCIFVVVMFLDILGSWIRRKVLE